LDQVPENVVEDAMGRTATAEERVLLVRNFYTFDLFPNKSEEIQLLHHKWFGH
jgi:hypothetical protein